MKKNFFKNFENLYNKILNHYHLSLTIFLDWHLNAIIRIWHLVNLENSSKLGNRVIKKSSIIWKPHEIVTDQAKT